MAKHRDKIKKNKSKFSFWDKKVEFPRGIAEKNWFLKPKLGQKWQKKEKNCQKYKKYRFFELEKVEGLRLKLERKWQKIKKTTKWPKN